MEKLISIIVPVYNGEKYIKQCLMSIVNQTYKNIEIIVIDDGSTDCSKNIIKKIMKKDSRILLIEQKNKGVSNSRNKALDIAKGEYIIFVDADDWIEDCCVENMLNKIIELKADVLQFNIYKNSKDKQFKEKQFSYVDCDIEKIQLSLINSRYVQKKYNLILGNLRTVWGKIYRKSIIGNTRFNTKVVINEDGFFNLEIFLKNVKIFFVNDYLYHYRISDNSADNKFRNNYEEINHKNINLMRNMIDVNLNEEFQKVLNLFIYENFMRFLNNKIMNKNNKDKFCYKYSNLRKELSNKELKQALKNIDAKYVTYFSKITIFLIKKNLPILLYVYSRIKSIFISRI